MLTLSLLFFFDIECSVSMGLVFYYKGHIRIGNNAKNPANLEFFFVIKITQLNAVHAQLLKYLGQSAFAETCRFQTIQSLEFQEIWQKNK